MPNHFHGIIEILDTWQRHDGKELISKDEQIISTADLVKLNAEQPKWIAPTGTKIPQKSTSGGLEKKKLGEMIGAFTSITTVEYIRGVKNDDWKKFDGKLWQRNYWEHIIRHERSFSNITNYIINNAANWEKDKFYKTSEI